MWHPYRWAKHSKIRIRHWARVTVTYSGRLPVIAGILVLAIVVLPSWCEALVAQSHDNAPANTLSAEAWVERYVPTGTVVVVNDYMLTDLELHSHVLPVWLWKIDLDPAVMAHDLPHGWRSIGYIIWDPESTAVDLGELPTLQTALNRATVVKRFGTEITIYKVAVNS